MYEVVKIHHPRRFLRRKITKRIEKHRRRTASHHLRELGSDQEFFFCQSSKLYEVTGRISDLNRQIDYCQ